VDGFSMGGFGAAHLGFKYPEVFGVVSIEAPALLGPDVRGPGPAEAWAKLFPVALGSDMAYFQANDPFALAVKNADAIRDRMLIRIATHRTPGEWQSGRCDELHELLLKQMIPHEFYFESNVRTHNRGLMMDSMGDSSFTLFSTALPQWQIKGPPAKP
jgi:endo-1,4-beta-xylanase